MGVYRAGVYSRVCSGCSERRKSGEPWSPGHQIQPGEPYLLLSWGEGTVHGRGYCACHPDRIDASWYTAGAYHLRKECYGQRVKDPALLRRVGAKVAGAKRSKRIATRALREREKQVGLQHAAMLAWQKG